MISFMCQKLKIILDMASTVTMNRCNNGKTLCLRFSVNHLKYYYRLHCLVFSFCFSKIIIPILDVKTWRSPLILSNSGA